MILLQKYLQLFMLQNFCVSAAADRTALTARERAVAAPMKTLDVGNCLVEDGMMAVPPT